MKPPDWYDVQKYLVETVPIPRGYFHVKEGISQKHDLAVSSDSKTFTSIICVGSNVEDYYMVIRPIAQCTQGYVTTVSGQRVSLLNPERRQIKIDDLAHHLAWTCRFNGHMRR